MIPHGKVLVLDADRFRAHRIARFLEFFGYRPRIHEHHQRLDERSLRDEALTGVVVVSERGDARSSAWVDTLNKHAPHLPALHVDSEVERMFDQALPEAILPGGGRNSCRHLPTGTSPRITELVAQIRQVAPFNTTVLILGESGTGKERVARSVHAHSGRRAGAFVPLNCGAIPSELMESELFGHEKGAFTGALSARKGRFELAEGGTLFLDEIGDMTPDMQVKLLRVLQERTFERVGGFQTIQTDVRIIAATHRDLKQAVREGQFREDLYYRLHVFPLHVPALRERIVDLPLLIEELTSETERANGVSVSFSSESMALLARYDWPGNVRELANLVERLAIIHQGTEIRSEHLPAEHRVAPRSVADLSHKERPATQPSRTIDLKVHLQKIEQELIEHALAQANGVVAEAARMLRLGRTTLVEKIRKYGIDSESTHVA